MTGNFPYQRIVVGVPARLGDALFCTPAISLIKKHCPGCHIDAVVPTELAKQVLAGLVDQTFVAPVVRPKRGYDLAIALHESDKIQQLLQPFNCKVVAMNRPSANEHQAEATLQFVAELIGCDISEADRQYVLQAGESPLETVNQSGPLIGLHLGCHSVAKQGLKLWRRLSHPKIWPWRNFLALAKNLQAAYPQATFVLTGAKSEVRLVNKFIRHLPTAINLAGQTNVAELARLLSQVTVFVTPDTGVLHVACAMKTPTIALFGPTALARTGPYPSQGPCEVIQAKSLVTITPAQVAEKIMPYLETS